MSSSDFGYKFLNRELNRSGNSPSPVSSPAQRSYWQGPLQRQTQADPDLSSAQPFPNAAGQLDWERSQVLPQVFDFLGRAGVDREILERGRNELADQQRQREEAAAERRRLRDFREGPTPAVEPQYLGDGYRGDVQRPITGLNKAITEALAVDEGAASKELVQGFQELTRTYPELIPLLQDQSQNQDQGRSTRIRGRDFTPYLQYADTEQMYSDPGDRAALYNRLGNTDTGKLYNFSEIESRYVSGDPQLQAAAREDLLEAGATPAELSAIETSAFQQNRPVIGGGGYTPLSDSDDARYISDRSRAFNDLVDRAYKSPAALRILQETYPGLEQRGNRNYGRSASFDYDLFDNVVMEPGADVDQYTVRVSKSRNPGRLLDLDDITGVSEDVEISRNALKFLRDFPVYSPQSISFMTAAPGESPSFQSNDDIPEDIRKRMQSFVMDESLSNNRAGSILENSPLDSSDLIERARSQGKDAQTSSYLRKAEPFIEARAALPNFRGLAYSGAGFGPVDQNSLQFAYVDTDGNMIPLQMMEADRPLRGSVRPRGEEFISTPALPANATPRYFASFLPGADRDAFTRLAGRVRAVPASLAPGASDLIPSAEAVNALYNKGPQAAGQQMALDFAAGIPLSAALVPVLSSPAVAPAAPGIGLGFLGVAGTEAANELTKQETGKSLAQRFQETMGAVSGDTSLVGTTDRGINPDSNPGREQARRELERVNTPPTIQASDWKAPDRSGENEIQRRLRLASEARQKDPWDFGVTELLFGR